MSCPALGFSLHSVHQVEGISSNFSFIATSSLLRVELPVLASASEGKFLGRCVLVLENRVLRQPLCKLFSARAGCTVRLPPTATCIRLSLLFLMLFPHRDSMLFSLLLSFPTAAEYRKPSKLRAAIALTCKRQTRFPAPKQGLPPHPSRSEDEQEILGASLPRAARDVGPALRFDLVALYKVAQLVAGSWNSHCQGTPKHLLFQKRGSFSLSFRLERTSFPSKDLILCRNCITFLNLKLCQGELLSL